MSRLTKVAIPVKKYNRRVDLVCPACTAPELSFDGKFTFRCAYCDTTFVAGSTECPACGTRNSRAAEYCSNCQEPLSIVASIMDRQGVLGPPLWVRRLRSQVGELKRTAEEASVERLSAFQEIDRRRIESETLDQARQEQRDRNIIFYGLIGLLILALMALAFVALR